MNALMQWFNRYNRREQLLLTAAAGLLVIYLLYVLVWAPLAESQQTLALQNQRAQETLVNVQALAARYRQLEGAGSQRRAGTDLSLSQIIDQTVAANQLSLKRYQPSSDGDAQVRFENMPFNNLLAWLNQMESEYGLVVKDLAISPGSAAGVVNLSVRLSRGV